jgi:hypothetical protein
MSRPDELAKSTLHRAATAAVPLLALFLAASAPAAEQPARTWNMASPLTAPRCRA